jgi:5'-methylthioadenosine phosphorylase
MTDPIARIAVIGGSGLYNMPELTDKETHDLETPFGKPSAPIVVGTLRGQRVAFLARHGIGHHLTPSEVPYRANLYALKMLGVRFILAANACGSLREEYAPGHLVLPTQLYDNTKSERGGRSFFGGGIVGHVGVADPFSPELAAVVKQAAADEVSDATLHHGGTFIIIEGPRFSTRGESEIFRSWGCSLIGMTTCPEAFLAREAEIAYVTLAHITDYDVWHTSAEPVTVEMVMTTMRRNIDHVQRIIAATVQRIDPHAEYAAHHALDNTVMTAPERIAPHAKATLRLLLGNRYAD